MEFSKIQFYSAFNEIDETVRADGGYEPLLRELQIDITDILKHSVRQSVEAIKTVQEAATEVIAQASARNEKLNVANFVTDLNANIIEVMAANWAEGFLSHLIIQEQLGMTWPPIGQELFEKGSALKGASLSGLLNDKQFFQISQFRTLTIIRRIKGQKPPIESCMVFNAYERKYGRFAQCLFGDGFLHGSLVEYIKQE